MSKHTPGPLRAGCETRDAVFPILTHSGMMVGLAMCEDDAKLWAEAPAMLEALRSIVDRADRQATVSFAVTGGWDFSKGHPPAQTASGLDDARAILSRIDSASAD